MGGRPAGQAIATLTPNYLATLRRRSTRRGSIVTAEPDTRRLPTVFPGQVVDRFMPRATEGPVPRQQQFALYEVGPVPKLVSCWGRTVVSSVSAITSPPFHQGS